LFSHLGSPCLRWCVQQTKPARRSGVMTLSGPSDAQMVCLLPEDPLRF
jgi:hypothetical protein